MLNLPGIAGMAAAMELLIDTGVEAIADRLLHLRAHLLDAVRPGGWRTVLDGTVARQPANARSAIVTLTHPSADLEAAAKRLADARVTISLRKDRAGTPYLRLSPHFYNTEAELDRVAEALGG
jgi:selenocysteine lyase/cysteine desulfurase